MERVYPPGRVGFEPKFFLLGCLSKIYLDYLFIFKTHALAPSFVKIIKYWKKSGQKLKKTAVSVQLNSHK